jgi:hypothetical protein
MIARGFLFPGIIERLKEIDIEQEKERRVYSKYETER